MAKVKSKTVLITLPVQGNPPAPPVKAGGLRHSGWFLVVVCYALALVVYVGSAGFALVRDTLRANRGTLVQTQLLLGDFAQSGIKPLEEDDGLQIFVTTDDDAQLIYTPEQPFYAGIVKFIAVPNKPTGAIVLYYTTSAGAGFSERNKMWARQNSSGEWYFNLGGRKVHSLRLDPDSLGGVEWQMEGVTVGGRQAPAEYFAPTPLRMFIMLLVPGLAAALLLELTALLAPLLRSKKSRKAGK